MTKRSKLIIVLSVLVLFVWTLLLVPGPVFARAGGGRAISSSAAKTSVAPTKTSVPGSKTGVATGVVAGAAGGAVVGAAAARARAGAPSAPSEGIKGGTPPAVDMVAALKPAAAEAIIFNYDPKGKPDPFQPFVEAELALRKLKEAQLKRKQQQLPLSPLQRAGIEQFKLVGIGGNEKGKTAVVQDMAGKYYTLSIGTPIGMNNGKVARILGDRVVVEEPAAGGRKGKTGAKRVEMKLLKEGEEVKP